MNPRLWLGLLVALALPTCAPSPSAPPSSPPPIASPPPREVEPPDDERVAITGHLQAHDGTPLRTAEIVVRRAGVDEQVAHAVLDDEGRFAVEVPPGIYLISIQAADHDRLVRHTVVTDALHVEGRLGARSAANQEAQVQWTGERAPTATMVGFSMRWRDALFELQGRFPRKDGKILEESDELHAETSAMAAKAREQAEAEPDPTTRALLRIACLAIFDSQRLGPEEAARRREEVAWLVEHVPPTEPHLALLAGHLDDAVFLARQDADAAYLAKLDAWLEQRAREHADPSSALLALNLLLYDADLRGDVARVEELYALVLDERFEGATFQRILQNDHDPNRILQRGKPFPAFDFAPLHEGEPRITSTDRTGRLYLLEFWATWCGPCVKQMPDLHAAYAAINGAKPGKGRGEAALRRLRPVDRPKLEFVFISLDEDPSEVDEFRKQHWSMPWTHAWVGRDGMAEVQERYGFSGSSMIVLVDESGTILEAEKSLRGDQLLPTLERVLAERSAAASP